MDEMIDSHSCTQDVPTNFNATPFSYILMPTELFTIVHVRLEKTVVDMRKTRFEIKTYETFIFLQPIYTALIYLYLAIHRIGGTSWLVCSTCSDERVLVFTIPISHRKGRILVQPICNSLK